MNILALITMMIHYILVMFIIITPFTGGLHALIVHIASSVSILFHWVVNNDTCCLTLLENKLRGVESSSSFINGVVSPIYKFAEDDVNKLSYITLTVLCGISAYNLHKILEKKRKSGENFLTTIFKKN